MMNYRPAACCSHPTSRPGVGGWWRIDLRAAKPAALLQVRAGCALYGPRANGFDAMAVKVAAFKLRRAQGPGSRVGVGVGGRGSSWGLDRAGHSSPPLVLVPVFPRGVVSAPMVLQMLRKVRNCGGDGGCDGSRLGDLGELRRQNVAVVCGSTAERLRNHRVPSHSQPGSAAFAPRSAPYLVRMSFRKLRREGSPSAPPDPRARQSWCASRCRCVHRFPDRYKGAP